jgi:hypothetical protein
VVVRRLKTFMRQQGRAWSMLFAPAPKPFVWPEITGGEHPSELCRCAGVPVSHHHASRAVDHDSDCPWLAAMCRTCTGTGWCITCGGDGTQPSEAAP